MTPSDQAQDSEDTAAELERERVHDMAVAALEDATAGLGRAIQKVLDIGESRESVARITGLSDREIDSVVDTAQRLDLKAREPTKDST